MTVRLLVRFFTSKPQAANPNHPALDRFATLAHYAFYLLVLLMATSGIATAILRARHDRVRR
jgi:cytochrome b561